MVVRGIYVILNNNRCCTVCTRPHIYLNISRNVITLFDSSITTTALPAIMINHILPSNIDRCRYGIRLWKKKFSLCRNVRIKMSIIRFRFKPSGDFSRYSQVTMILLQTFIGYFFRVFSKYSEYLSKNNRTNLGARPIEKINSRYRFCRRWPTENRRFLRNNQK